MMCSALFLILCLGFASVKSAVIHIDQVEISGHEGKCYDKDEKIFYNKGEIIRNEGTECAERKCLGFVEEIGQVRIEVLTCPAVEAGPGCAIVQDPSKPYPDCCPQLVSMPSIDPKYCVPKKKEKE